MIRSATPEDLDLLLSARQIEPVAFVDADRFRRELDQRQYRLEWSWLHEVEGRLLARALWWGPPDHRFPVLLDCIWVDMSLPDPAPLVARLVNTAQRSFRDAGLEQLPDANLTVATGWKDDPDAVAALTWRTGALAAAGLSERIERLSYAWTPEDGLPQRSALLTFSAADNQAFLDVFAAVAQGSLDLLPQRGGHVFGSGGGGGTISACAALGGRSII
ncbi:hypothetical protein E8P82_01135 [Arthrobacter echini]|uniref:GNAT family N-acetyltransferase n=1 Tax=Arthrobacter echini TaxID=1529066 RepID=A0A4S5EA44_9MICC|nr:hypothetical protein [Arthrobacter echini]THJ68548.1 hypothetical protein E8P82_01135 [Arthrobacter echini]